MQKRKLCFGILLSSWRLFKLPSHIQNSKSRIFKVLLLEARRKGILTFFLFSNFETLTIEFRSFIFDQFGLASRSTNSMLIAIASKTFLTSAVKGLTWLFATTTKICTDAWFRQDHSLNPLYQLSALHGTIKCITPTYKMKNKIYFLSICRLYVGTLVAPLIFKAVAFVRRVFTHSLADSKFHGHSPNVFIQQHFLWFLIMSVHLWHI